MHNVVLLKGFPHTAPVVWHCLPGHGSRPHRLRVRPPDYPSHLGTTHKPQLDLPVLLTSGYTLGLPEPLLWVLFIYLSNSENPGKYLNQPVVKTITKGVYAGYSEGAWGRSVECPAFPRPGYASLRLCMPTYWNPHAFSYLKSPKLVLWAFVGTSLYDLIAGRPGVETRWGASF